MLPFHAFANGFPSPPPPQANPQPSQPPQQPPPPPSFRPPYQEKSSKGGAALIWIVGGCLLFLVIAIIVVVLISQQGGKKELGSTECQLQSLRDRDQKRFDDCLKTGDDRLITDQCLITSFMDGRSKDEFHQAYLANCLHDSTGNSDSGSRQVSDCLFDAFTDAKNFSQFDKDLKACQQLVSSSAVASSESPTDQENNDSEPEDENQSEDQYQYDKDEPSECVLEALQKRNQSRINYCLIGTALEDTYINNTNMKCLLDAIVASQSKDSFADRYSSDCLRDFQPLPSEDKKHYKEFTDCFYDAIFLVSTATQFADQIRVCTAALSES